MPVHIRKGDAVMVTAGNDKGTVGTVLRVMSDKDRVLVQGVNIRTKHVKPSQARPQGGLIRREMPIHISNVSPVVDGKPTRVRFPTKPDGTKVRAAARDGKELHTLHGPRASAASASAAAGSEQAAGTKKVKSKPKAKKSAS